MYPSPTSHISALILAASILSVAAVVQADDSKSDSTLPSFSHLAEQTKESCNDAGQFSFGLSALVATGSEEVNTGFGIAFTGFFNDFEPFVPRASLDLFISSLDADSLSDAQFVTVSPSFGLMLRRTSGKMQPYVGIGVNFHTSYMSFDEPEDISISGYDTTTQARKADLGWGVSPHLRLGLIASLGEQLGLLVECRIMSASHTADVEYRDRLTREEWTGTVDYDIPTVWISVGIVSDP